MVNVGEMDRVVTFLEDNPQLHHQNNWMCHTTACVAGWTYLLNSNINTAEQLSVVADDFTGTYTETDIISNTARRILGLTDGEAYALFILTGYSMFSNYNAINLMHALIERDKGHELSSKQRELLYRYELDETMVPTDV